MRDDTCSKLSHSMLPWYTAGDISEALLQQHLPYIFDQNYCPPHNIVRCHVIQPLPSAEDWKAAYALDRDTNDNVQPLNFMYNTYTNNMFLKSFKSLGSTSFF